MCLFPCIYDSYRGRTYVHPNGFAQIKCKILEGFDKDKIMRRNIRGPVLLGDILMLKETEMEATPIK